MVAEWIPLLVPSQDYIELAALVEKRQRDRGPDATQAVVVTGQQSEVASSVPRVVSNAVAQFEAWSVADLRKLATSKALTAQRWARAMDVCSSEPERFFSTQEVAELSGMSVNEWRDAPRKISRHLASNYPGAPGWPLVVASGRNLGHAYDQAYWAITDLQAQRWSEAKGSGA